MIPKIIFRRSWIYDKLFVKKKDFVMPSEKVFEKHIKKLKRQWSKFGSKILKEITRITKLNWREREIVCYITTGVTPFSDPLTLNLQSDINTLTHELIHRILSELENTKKIKKNWMRLMKKHQNESPKTKTHIIIYAAHIHIFKKFFGGEKLNKAKKVVLKSGYIRSWEIVDKDGYQNIIKELTRGLRS